MRIVVCGYMIRYPSAGNLLAYFHYVVGLRRLGHEVLYLEESGWPGACYDPHTGDYGDDPRPGLRAVRTLLTEQAPAVPVCYVDRDSGTVSGVDWAGVKGMLAASDLLLNLGGVCWLPEFALCRRRALVDMDPFFTQLGRFGGSLLADHHVHFSYGVNVGRPGCAIPTAGVDWLPTVPPVIPDLWADGATGLAEPEGGSAVGDRAFTSVANWSAYGAVTFEGERYGQKDEEFERLLDLPQRTSHRLELALAGAGVKVVERLRAAGWSVRAAGEVCIDVPTYQTYVTGSRGELSAAKHAYVKTRSGWFSDRSVCYLAAGLPVILQDTGFSEWLPTGRGVLAFSSAEEASECIERVNAAYPAHRHAARETAAQTFDYRVVLPKLLEGASSQRWKGITESSPGGGRRG